MRYVVVKRVTLLLGLLFVVTAGVFAWLVRDEPPAVPSTPAAAPTPVPDGASLFDRRCGPCHEAADLGQQLRDGGDATRVRWEAFLRDHAEATDAEDRLILEYLAAGKR